MTEELWKRLLGARYGGTQPARGFWPVWQRDGRRAQRLQDSPESPDLGGFSTGGLDGLGMVGNSEIDGAYSSRSPTQPMSNSCSLAGRGTPVLGSQPIIS